MFVTTEYWSPSEVEVKHIEPSLVGEVVTVEGSVENFSSYGGNTFFDLKNGNSSIKAVKFEPMDLKEGAQIRVEGEIAVYRGEMEIIIDRVIK